MIKKTSILFSMWCGTMAFAQPEALQDILAKESCECVNAKKSTFSNPDVEMLKKEFGLCVLASYVKHSAEFEKEFKLDFSDKEQLRSIGERTAIKMIDLCPEVIMAIGVAANQGEAETISSDMQIEGSVSGIKTDQFVTLQVKDKNGRVHNLLLLDYFETASLFTNNDIKKNDRVTVNYSEVEMYDPAAKEFRYYKVITGLAKNN